MDKNFVKDWFEQRDIYKNPIDYPPFDMILTEFNNNFYPRRTCHSAETKKEVEELYTHYLIPPSEIREVIDKLLDYCDRYTDGDIEVLNEKIREEREVEFNIDDYGIEPLYKIKKSKCRAGYIYMLKCADKVKIGYSKNVEQRIKQLDVRPFDIELVFKEYNEAAYQIEQIIHRCLEDYRLKGEWYSDEITEELINDMITEINYELEIVEGE